MEQGLSWGVATPNDSYHFLVLTLSIARVEKTQTGWGSTLIQGVALVW